KAAAEIIDDPAAVEAFGCPAARLKLVGGERPIEPASTAVERRHHGAQIARLHEGIAGVKIVQGLLAHGGDRGAALKRSAQIVIVIELRKLLAAFDRAPQEGSYPALRKQARRRRPQAALLLLTRQLRDHGGDRFW